MSRYQKGKPIWILLKQETVGGSGISWAICKSAPRSRQNHASTPPLSFLQAGCPSCRPTNSIKALKAVKNRPTALIIQYFVRIHKMRILSLWLAVYVCVQTVLASQNATSSSAAAAGVDEVYAMSSLDLSDVMDDFSQMNVLSVVVACLLMVHTHTHTHRRTSPTPPPDTCIQSHTHAHTRRLAAWRSG